MNQTPDVAAEAAQGEHMLGIKAHNAEPQAQLVQHSLTLLVSV